MVWPVIFSLECYRLARAHTHAHNTHVHAHRSREQLRHFKIIQEYGSYYLGNDKFPSLSAIVGFYTTTFICDDLCLQFPLPPEVMLCVCVGRVCIWERGRREGGKGGGGGGG